MSKTEREKPENHQLSPKKKRKRKNDSLSARPALALPPLCSPAQSAAEHKILLTSSAARGRTLGLGAGAALLSGRFFIEADEEAVALELAARGLEFSFLLLSAILASGGRRCELSC